MSNSEHLPPTRTTQGGIGNHNSQKHIYIFSISEQRPRKGQAESLEKRGKKKAGQVVRVFVPRLGGNKAGPLLSGGLLSSQT